MKNTPTESPKPFGDVDTDIEHGIFVVDTRRGHDCRLTLLGRTERGYPRTELATISGKLWKEIGSAVEKELIRGMQDREQTTKKRKGDDPTLATGENALSTLLTRELAVLLWALMEDQTGKRTDALFAGWKQLAAEERWWLFARASGPAQKQGHGWRHALLFALDDPAETRTAVQPKESSDSKQNDITPRKKAVKKRVAKKATAKKKSPTSPRSPVTTTQPSGSAAKPKRSTKKSQRKTPAKKTKKTQPEASAKDLQKPTARKTA
ncbi:DUF3780 domain-containing protein [Stieleria sp. TO1_6]|uniref:DUF3780 domain-containing protein n=1 Tax=Stieleria tagensis TaxID=2956795 RepID=UPI00209B46E5|nr:DUF3780 domain-containing protein [Stieleria tagensis]MCO8122600.1 DUF3780 domain-containing protein [Stieleria tagensis]